MHTILTLIRKVLGKINNKKIGGGNFIVEIDETAVTKRKFKRGRMVSTMWCVGGICRVHKTFFLNLRKREHMMFSKKS